MSVGRRMAIFDQDAEAPPGRMSRGFRALNTGVALTIVAKVGPWLWPAWPAVTVLDFVLARAQWSVVPPHIKALGLVALMIINIGFWGVIAWLLMYAWSYITRRIAAR